MSTLAKRITAPPAQCCALWSESIALSIEELRRSKIKASRNVRSYPKKPNERVGMAQVKGIVERDRRHVKNSPLSEIGASKGARGLSGIVGSKRLRILMDSSC